MHNLREKKREKHKERKYTLTTIFTSAKVYFGVQNMCMIRRSRVCIVNNSFFFSYENVKR